MAAMGISFGIVIGKEVFGGVGFNILNPALTARAFVFFTYPAYISGAKTTDGLGVWSAAGQWMPGMETVAATDLIAGGTATVDGYSGATPLLAVSNGLTSEAAEKAGVAYQNAEQILTENGWTFLDMFYGFIPGSMGETSALACLIGAAFLIVTGIGSWRIMIGCVAGMLATATLFTFVGDPGNPLMTLPPHYHLVMGGFAFGTVFMATDPVSAAVTPMGRWIYGISIGALCALVRVVNPAYPEGMMLAILFMNVFSPVLDYYVVKASTRRRASRLAG
jgi:Na+-transporting NADH:ubiquinone oxidoreductase subunit B